VRVLLVVRRRKIGEIDVTDGRKNVYTYRSSTRRTYPGGLGYGRASLASGSVLISPPQYEDATMKLFASTFSALALMAAVGQAAPFEVKNVAADAKWVVHVDVDAVR